MSRYSFKTDLPVLTCSVDLVAGCRFDSESLEKKVRELYAIVCRLEEEKYDWEGRLGRQTEEVMSISMQGKVKGRVCDTQ